MRYMVDKEIAKPITATHLAAASVAFTGAAATVLLLASLHVLNPEFDPRWRMVSEYANGHYGWVLSLMFASWAVSSWALALAIRSQVETRAGRIGLVLLIVSGVGEAGASVFDLNNPLHDVDRQPDLGEPRPAGGDVHRHDRHLHPRRGDVTTASSKVPRLPSGVIALVGLTNSLLVVANCVWVAVVAGQAIRLRGREPRALAAAQ